MEVREFLREFKTPLIVAGGTACVLTQYSILASSILYRPCPPGLEIPFYYRLPLVALKVLRPHIIKIISFFTRKPRLEVGRSSYLSLPFSGSPKFEDLEIFILDFQEDVLGMKKVNNESEIKDGQSLMIRRKEGETYPGIVWIHGGGFTALSPRLYLPVTKYLAFKTGAVVISVAYPLSPENKFPAALNHCFDVSKKISENCEMFRIEKSKLVIVGESAGGNMAIGVGYKFNEAGSNPFSAQFLVYPGVQMLNFNLPSFKEMEKDPAGKLDKMDKVKGLSQYISGSLSLVEYMYNNDHVTENMAKKFNSVLERSVDEQYVNEFSLMPKSKGNTKVDIDALTSNYHLNPLMAPEDLISKSVKTFVYTSNFDILRDEQFIFVGLLKKCRVEVTHRFFPGSFHGCLSLYNKLPVSKKVLDSLAQDIVAQVNSS